LRRTFVSIALLLCLSVVARLAVARNVPPMVEATQDVKHNISPPLRDLPAIRDTQIHGAEPLKTHIWNIPFRPSNMSSWSTSRLRRLAKSGALPARPTAGQCLKAQSPDTR